MNPTPTDGRALPNVHLDSDGRDSAVPLIETFRGSTALAERSVDHCEVLDLPKIPEPRGNLTFIEGGRHIPFDIARVYYLYDVPGGAARGGHAHRALHQLMIAMSGSFDVLLDDGRFQKKVHLNRSYKGLYIPPMIWRELDNFSSGAVCMVLASERYDEADYYRDHSEFIAAVRNEQAG